ncbi:RNA 2',3'-cyclic phosphodiesterase [Cupriavidus pauculus]|uniref:RNA 2',3'-cyclic phosphodiesterase n=1 Tax=Cupriavidus pauculus TaxID=82633 RepID=A0A2N5C4G7_9BURK|nr:RNA 2',3'-cyclic phosphodiesterase [Cupriavidus pauculus]PLP97123.1 RNA 2',3'-cyclic phosphodiesterase [Cupriavidus pauculus]
MPRLFIAIDTPAALADALLQTLPAHRDIRPTPTAQLHLTLRFLGECDAAAIAAIAQALHAVAARPLVLQVSGVGRFRGRQGSILWAGLAESAPLQGLVDAVSAALDTLGIAPDPRRFRPHLTLARCRPGAPEPLLRDWLGAFRDLAPPPWQVDRFLLYESVLGPEGAQHAVRDTYRAISPDC